MILSFVICKIEEKYFGDVIWILLLDKKNQSRISTYYVTTKIYSLCDLNINLFFLLFFTFRKIESINRVSIANTNSLITFANLNLFFVESRNMHEWQTIVNEYLQAFRTLSTHRKKFDVCLYSCEFRKHNCKRII